MGKANKAAWNLNHFCTQSQTNIMNIGFYNYKSKQTEFICYCLDYRLDYCKGNQWRNQYTAHEERPQKKDKFVSNFFPLQFYVKMP